MRRQLLFLALSLSICAPCLAEKYVTGTLVRVNAGSIGNPNSLGPANNNGYTLAYELSIQYRDRYYNIHFLATPGFKFDWQVNGRVQFRIDKYAIYLRHANGKEERIAFAGGDASHPFERPSHVTVNATPAMSDLPFPALRQQPADASAPALTESSRPLPPYCAKIAAMGPEYRLLEGACRFALSSRSLPDYICRETTRRWVNGRPHDLVTADATFVHGSDRYSNLKIDGQPVPTLDGSGGLITGQLFGAQLWTIFRPETATTFTWKDEEKAGATVAAVFSFSFKSRNNSSYRLNAVYPSLSGTIWVDRQSGQLMRVQTTATEITPESGFSSYQSIIDYAGVAIPGLGRFLAPLDGEAQMCRAFNQKCAKNVVSFADYRRFASTAAIISDTGP